MLIVGFACFVWFSFTSECDVTWCGFRCLYFVFCVWLWTVKRCINCMGCLLTFLCMVICNNVYKVMFAFLYYYFVVGVM